MIEQILEIELRLNPNNTPYDEMYNGEKLAILRAMEIYAKECVKASLEDASEMLINDIPNLEPIENKIKESITNSENIILL